MLLCKGADSGGVIERACRAEPGEHLLLDVEKQLAKVDGMGGKGSARGGFSVTYGADSNSGGPGTGMFLGPNSDTAIEE